VLCGFSQEQGVDFDKMFSPVVKSAMVRIILSIALSLKWETRQLDSKLAEVIYNRNPPASLTLIAPSMSVD
jgi:hypothetical protein